MPTLSARVHHNLRRFASSAVGLLLLLTSCVGHYFSKGTVTRSRAGQVCAVFPAGDEFCVSTKFFPQGSLPEVGSCIEVKFRSESSEPMSARSVECPSNVQSTGE